MSSAFLSMSVATVALIFALVRGMPESARSRIGTVLLGVWALGVLIAMIFPTDAPGAQETLPGRIHDSSGPLTFLSLCAAMLLMSWHLKRDDAWRPIYPTAMGLSLVFLAAFVGTFVSFVADLGFTGLTQRIALAAAVSWMVLMGAHLYSTAPGNAG
jgi:hypothetical protein